MKKIALYTAIFGQPGRFNFPEISIKNVDKICYTNLGIDEGCNQMIPISKGRFLKNEFYEMRRRDPDQPTSVMQQRFMKIVIPDEIFNNYEYSVYVDCKRPAQVDFKWALKCLEDGSDFLTRKHRERDCLYAEGKICIDKKKDSKDIIKRQLDFYKSENYPHDNGLYWTVKLFRRHTPALLTFSHQWWEQLVKFSHRDQISLPYVAWKHNMKISTYRKRK